MSKIADILKGKENGNFIFTCNLPKYLKKAIS